MKIYITSPGNPVGCHHFGILEEDGIKTHTIQLADGEHIVSVFGKSGFLIDELSFETSNSKRFGPFGGGGGSRRNIMDNLNTFREEGKFYDLSAHRYRHSVAPAPHSRIPLDTVLVGVAGTRILDQGNYCLTHLSFCFRLFTPGSAFLVGSDRMCEVDAMEHDEPDGEWR